MPVTLLALTLLAPPSYQRVAPAPAIAISVWYAAPMTVDLAMLRDHLARIRGAGFDAITTTVAWRDAHPRRGAFRLLEMDRVIAAATEAGLSVRVKVLMDARPAWDPTDEDAGAFFDYLRRRAFLHPVVLTVDAASLNETSPFERIAVGAEPDAVSPRLARLRLWTAVARGARNVGFVGTGNLLTPALLAVGETAGVVTRNQALFGPLRPRASAGDASADGGIELRILESEEAMLIVGLNHADAARNATLRFSREIPAGTWQNIEEGGAVAFVMGKDGPFLDHTFAPHDVLVLTIRKKLWWAK
ncbi:MAG: hypothetical protein H0U19_01100 [Acidobacteria bacterium]|nr:hypothetical protein [Acidobacteriota bacterium]